MGHLVCAGIGGNPGPGGGVHAKQPHHSVRAAKSYVTKRVPAIPYESYTNSIVMWYLQRLGNFTRRGNYTALLFTVTLCNIVYFVLAVLGFVFRLVSVLIRFGVRYGRVQSVVTKSREAFAPNII